ncbi:MAG: hypothetical protein EBQ66_10790 [Flavobacteriia bacterium]|uniref:Uncharacterized protein n=1 Tax=viral metagenome TaxID=1070528 RepID=A0A6C0E1F9_9ZZZZ|nr:hypothetical protein [Flavobacteriia bacterium]
MSYILQTLSTEPIKTMVLSIVAACILFVVYLGIRSKDIQAGTQHFMGNVIYIVVPVVALLCILLIAIDPKFGSYAIVGTIIGIVLFLATFYFLTTTISQYIFNRYLMYLIIGAIALVALTIVVTVGGRNFRASNQWTGFFTNMLFYIPCLIRDAIKTMTNEYASTPTTTMILFVLEIVLISMFLYLFPWIDTLGVPENIVILKEPVMLNRRMDFTHKMKPCSICDRFDASGAEVEPPSFIVTPGISPTVEEIKSRNNWIQCIEDKVKTNTFAVSFWVYVIPSSKTKVGYTRETPIFYYGPQPSAEVNVKVSTAGSDTPWSFGADNQDTKRLAYIRMSYYNNDTTENQFMLHVQNISPTKDTVEDSVQVDMPLQRWNNIVLNYMTTKAVNPTTLQPYTESTLDVFINGKLTQTFPLSSEYMFYTSNVVRVGHGVENKNLDGLYGAICNVVYYSRYLPKMTIAYNYNRLVIKNPPI